MSTNKKFIIKSNDKREAIYVPFHKQWVQLSKSMLKNNNSNKLKNEEYYLYYVYQISWLAAFEQQAEFDSEGVLVKDSYLNENFDLLITKAEKAGVESICL